MTEGPRAALRQELTYFLQVLGLTAFAIAQPVLDVMGRSPETFVFRGADSTVIVLFALVVVVVPALGLWALAAATRPLGPAVRRWAHLGLLGALVAVIGIQVLKKVGPLRDVPLILVALGLGAVATWLIARSRAAGMWVRLAAIAPIPFLALFLFASPVSKLLFAPTEGAAASGAGRVPVVMVIFDELPLGTLMDRRGQINEDLYPHFARLASRSTWFRNYTVVERLTQYSIPTVLSGKVVTDRSKTFVAADHPDNLFTMLAESHRLEVLEPVTALCAVEACSRSGGDQEPAAATEGLGALLSDAALVWRDLSVPGETTRDVAAQFEQLADEEQPDDASAAGRPTFDDFIDSFAPGEPALYYYHSIPPHYPWERFPDGREYQVLGLRDLPRGHGKLGRRPWVEEHWPVQMSRQRHVLQVQYVDRLLGRMIDRLRDLGMYDDALVVVTSDHGASIHPGRHRRRPTQESMHELYWVPLFVKAPGQREGRIDDRNLMAPDLLPTIADLLDTEVPWETDGRSALEPGADRGPIKTIVRRRDQRNPWPEVTLRIPQAEAQRRLRREAFVPERPCERHPRMCPYLVGPGASLIGRPVESLTIGPPTDLTADLLLPRTLRPDEEGALPALVLGTATGPAGRGYDGRVLVAMNGSIAGVSDTWEQGDSDGWFGVLVPEFLLRAGPNDLRLFTLQGTVARPIGLAG